MDVHFLDGANNLVPNITDEDWTRTGNLPTWSGHRQRIALRGCLLRDPFENRVEIFDFGSGLGVEAVEICLNALQRHRLDGITDERHLAAHRRLRTVLPSGKQLVENVGPHLECNLRLLRRVANTATHRALIEARIEG